jgi:hypothetical protein
MMRGTKTSKGKEYDVHSYTNRVLAHTCVKATVALQQSLAMKSERSKTPPQTTRMSLARRSRHQSSKLRQCEARRRTKGLSFCLGHFRAVKLFTSERLTVASARIPRVTKPFRCPMRGLCGYSKQRKARSCDNVLHPGELPTTSGWGIGSRVTARWDLLSAEAYTHAPLDKKFANW